MCKNLAMLAIILAITGCGEMPSTGSTRAEPSRTNVHIQSQVGGAPFDDEPPHLTFTITTVHRAQKPATAFPFHLPGGDWTFFDCKAGTADFTVGVMAKGDGKGQPIAWGRAVMIVQNQEAGGRFVEAFRQTFKCKVRPRALLPHNPGPFFINTAILGENIQRAAKGGFSNEVGGWTATKWFPEHDGRSGEVFFNYNLEEKQGEFSEKDPEYADDLQAMFISALRDGPRPERTPENDPNITRTGPKIGELKKLLGKRSSYYAFSPRGGHIVYQNGPVTLALPANTPAGTPFEIAHLDHTPWNVHVLDEDLKLLVQEGIPETTSGMRSSNDPMSIWWINHKTKEKKLLFGPQKDLALAEAPVSPDQRFIALSQWRGEPGKGRAKHLIILDRQTGKTAEFVYKDLTVIGWNQGKAVGVTNRWRTDEKSLSETFLADPTTGKLDRMTKVDPRFDIDNPLSPDGKHKARLGKTDLTVTDADGKERRLVLHEDDRKWVSVEAMAWVSPRYLRFNAQRLAFIDVTTMKMSFPVRAIAPQFASQSYVFSPDVQWALCEGQGTSGEALYLAPVEMPKD